jgi:hypothetical protein
MSLTRRLAHIVFWIATALVIVVVAVAITIETPWFKDWLRRFAVERAAQYLNGELHIQRLGGSLLRGVEIDGLALTQGDVTLIKAERVTVRYSPIRMWREGLSFDTIEVRQPDVHVVQDAHGWNVANLVKPRRTPSSKPATFRIEQITVVDADVTVSPLKAERRHLSDVDLEGELQQKAGAFTMTIERLTGRDDGTGYTVSRLSGTFDGTFSHADVGFAAANQASQVSGRVTAAPRADGRDIRGEIDMTRLDLAPLLERRTWTSDITGHASVHAVVASTPGSPAVIAFQFNGPSASAFGYSGTDLDVRGQYTDNRVTFEGRADGYGAAATISASLKIPGGSAAPIFSGHGTFSHANLTQLPKQLAIPPFASSLSGEYRVATAGSSWNADVTLGTSRFEGATVASGTIGHIDAQNGVIRYEGTGELQGLNVRSLSAPLRIALLGEERFESSLNGSFHAAGVESKGTRQLSAEATLTGSSMAGATFQTMCLTAALDGRALDVTAQGDFQGLTGTLPDLPDSVPLDLNGTTDVALTIPDYEKPFDAEYMNVRGQVRLDPSSIKGIEITSAFVDADLTAGVADIRALDVQGAGLRATAVGAAALGTTGSSNLQVEATSDDLSQLGQLLDRPLKGGADLKATVTGPSNDTRATGTLNGHALNYGDGVSALTLNTTFDASVPDQDIKRVRVNARTEGTFVKVKNIELLSATAATTYADNEVAVEGHLEEQSRTLDLAGVMALGNGARDVIVRRLDLATAGTTWSLQQGDEARVKVGTDAITVENLTFGRGTQRIGIDGGFALAAGAVVERPLVIQTRDVEVADINHLLLGTQALEGIVNGEATIRGDAKSPDIDATLSITNGSVQAVHFDGVDAKVKYAGGTATVDAVLNQAPGAELHVTGTVPVAAPASENSSMDLTVRSNPIDLGLAQAFTNELTNIGGTGRFDVRVTGTLKAPIVDGTVDVAGGTFAVQDAGVQYRNLNTQLEIQRNHLDVASLVMEDDDKHVLRATGGIDLVNNGGARSFNIAFTTDDFHVMNNDLGLVQVDTDVRAEGDLSAPRIRGTVRIDQGRIEVDRVLETTTKDVYSTKPQEALDSAPVELAEQTAAASQPSGSLFDRVDVDIKLSMPDNLVLRGRDLRVASSSMGLGDMNIIAGGDLDLKKPAGKPISVTGLLQIVRGYYSFQGRRFEVQRDSSVRFRGQSPIDPSLNVAADRQISGVTATVGVRGSLSSPDIALSSKPPLDDADILSLIVFGQPVNDLGLGQRTSLSERAASMAASAIATPVADSVARALNLDLFEIQTDGTNAATVSLGSQIGTRLYVGLKQDVGQTETTALSLEYRFADFVRLVTSVVQNAAEKNVMSRQRQQSGVDMIFVFKY